MKRSLRVTALGLLLTVANVYFPVTARAQVTVHYQPGPMDPKVELAVVQLSAAPHSAVEHEHVLKAVSRSGFSFPFKIRISNTVCANKRSVDLDRSIWLADDPEHGGEVLELNLAANSTREFLVRTSRPDNTPLNSFNCIQLQAFDLRGKPVSNVMVIESFLPDPDDFR